MKHIAFWTEKSSADESIQTIKRLALSHALEGGDTGRVIASLIASDSFRELCEFELDYGLLTVLEARNCRQSLAFFKKCVYLPIKDVDPKKTSKEKFIRSELKCRETNTIFELRDQGLFSLEPWAEAAIKRAKAKISRVLGKLPSLSDLDFKFGPGSTTSVKKKNASPVSKLEAGFSCSEDLLPYASRILEEVPGWSDAFEIAEKQKETVVDDYLKTIDIYGYVPVDVTAGRVNFVLKDAMTLRSIVTEPSLNVIVQGAIGRYMSRRLKAFGIDLSDQSINQRLARIGSLTGELATLDLVSASDMIAIAIVKELLPWEWYFFLSTMRSGTVTCDGEPMKLEKFSSMGNGYTFPLQSLIFWALSSSVQDARSTTSVYGDDIIVDTNFVAQVMNILAICGFEVNKKKSFWRGPFRESCGADYVSGIDIRPWYHREMLSPADLFRLHNFYVRRDDFERAYLVRDMINPCLVIYGPDGYGDGHLLGPWSGKEPKRKNAGFAGKLFETYKEVGKREKRHRQPKAYHILPSYSIYVRENSDTVIPVVGDPSGELQVFKRFPYAPYKFFPEVVGSSGPLCSASYTPERYAIALRMRRLYQTAIATEPIPEVRAKRDSSRQDSLKAVSLPGTEGYKRVCIYTFNVG